MDMNNGLREKPLWLMTSHEGDEFESLMPRSFKNSGAIDAQGSGGDRMVTQVWDVDISGLEATPDIPEQPPSQETWDQGLRLGTLQGHRCEVCAKLVEPRREWPSLSTLRSLMS